jgi:hypothetical protein
MQKKLGATECRNKFRSGIHWYAQERGGAGQVIGTVRTLLGGGQGNHNHNHDALHWRDLAPPSDEGSSTVREVGRGQPTTIHHIVTYS